MEQTLPAANTEERRRFFRIPDQIILTFREVTAAQVAQIPPSPLADTHSELSNLATHLDALNQKARGLLHKFERQYPDIVDYLKLAEERLELLGRGILLSQELGDTGHATREVSLSACGVAFHLDNPLPVGGYLQLKMLLPPAMNCIATYGKVVYSRRAGGADSAGDFKIGVDFIGLGERDCEVLIRHVLRRQLESRRVRRDVT